MPNYNFEQENDNESNGSWYETDDETEIDEPIYDPEEPSLTKYNIVLCERYDGNKHGISSGVINNHFLTIVRLKELDMDYINGISLYTPGFLEIAECLYLQSEHCVSIIKTHWLKIIQRKWKKIYKDRKLIIARRCHPNALKYREINGTWPNYCINYPRLRGMLSKLSRTFSGTIC
jgi:hypothetical protein